MAKNIEKQGLRKGYIVGGIFALLLAAVLIMLYLPTFLQDAFNIGLIWDLSGTFTNLLGDNFMSLVNEWGTIAVLALLFLIYFICLCARPSTGSTFFRLCCMFACIGVALPFLVTQLNSILGEFDISQYINYGILGVFVLCFIFWLIAIISRSVKKYHKNKASSALAFNATFWLLLLAVFALSALNSSFSLGMDFITPVEEIFTNNLLAIIGIFLIIDAIWLFITVPHRVRVEYNTNTSTSNRPRMLDNTALTATAAAAGAGAGVAMQQGNAKFAHNYTNPQSFENNPVLNDNTTTQPVNAYPQRPAFVKPTVQPTPTPRPTVQNPLNQFTPTPTTNTAQSTPFQSNPMPRPFASNNNLNQQQTRTNPFGQSQTPNTQNFNAPRPIQPQPQPRPNPFGQQTQQPYARPQQPSRPPVTPFTTTQQPRPAQPPFPQQPRPTQPNAPQPNRPPVTPFTTPQQPRPVSPPPYPQQQQPRPVSPTPFPQQPRPNPLNPTQPNNQNPINPRPNNNNNNNGTNNW